MKWKFAMAGALAILVSASTGTAQEGDLQGRPAPNVAQANSSEPGSQPRTAVVLRFAVESQPVPGTPELAVQACPDTGDSAGSESLTVDPKILDTISAEMQKRLSKKDLVMLNPDPAEIPVGALVISGCITKAKPGNAGARLIGMNVGASRLSAHVVAFSKTKDGWSPVDTFDVKVKGGDLLPPLGPMGLAVHVARDTRQGLNVDGKKLADHILKTLSKDMNRSKALSIT